MFNYISLVKEGALMARLSVDKTLRQANSHSKKGEIAEAQKLYQSVLQAFPKNKRASQGLAALRQPRQNKKSQEQLQENINQLINLYNRKQLPEILEQAKILTIQHPKEFMIWNILGAAKNGLGQINDAVECFTKVTELNPKYADGFNNLGASLRSQGHLDKAIKAYKKALSLNPDYSEAYNNMGVALKEQGALDNALQAYRKALSLKPDYVEAYNNMGNALCEMDKLDDAIEACKAALVLRPDYAEAYCSIGAVLKKKGRLNDAFKSFKKALSLKPDYADALNNIGAVLLEQGNVDDAIAAFNEAVCLQTDYAEAWYNMGRAFQDKHNHIEAIEAYKHTLALAPDHAKANNNMGAVLEEGGEIELAVTFYKKALSSSPDYTDALENYQNLAIQLLHHVEGSDHITRHLAEKNYKNISTKPKYQINNAIIKFIERDFKQSQSHLIKFRHSEKSQLDSLTDRDRQYCNAYYDFVGELLGHQSDKNYSVDISKKVYHLGESHCLSFAHQQIVIKGESHMITPMITFGAKAYFLSREREDAFKAITKQNFSCIPKGANVFLSFGEIDCRPDEGFITAAKKQKKAIKSIVSDTVRDYITWFSNQNKTGNNTLFFFTVPAPVYNKNFSLQENQEVAKTVQLFNDMLAFYTKQSAFNLIDVYKFTVGDTGFSNSIFHIDSYHLGPKAIVEIEKSLI